MTRKFITPKSKDHWLDMKAGDISSTEVSALYNANPYTTIYELWHRKKNNHIIEIDETERMRWGNRLEAAIAQGIAEDMNWKVREFKDYVKLDGYRIGSSFDYLIDAERLGILEIKNVDSLQFRKHWLCEGDRLIEAPAHIEFQVQHQMLVFGAEYAYVAALVGGNKVYHLKRYKSEKVQNSILKKCEQFWKSVDEDTPPKPDFERDAEFIQALYAHTREGVMDCGGDEYLKSLVMKYNTTAESIKALSKEKDAIKAEILVNIKDAEKVKGDGFTISAGMVEEKEISFVRKPYRNFRVYLKKEKDNE